MLLEQQRRYHEERERLMDAMVQETINSEHRQRYAGQIYGVHQRTQRILLKAEVSVSMSVEFDEGKKLRENPNDEANNMVEFSDEEGYDK